MTAEFEFAVIGAGVVGLTIAHRLATDGHEVAVIDPNPPGSGASWGNAGTVADYAVQPVGTPDVLRRLPSLLFDRSSPLALRRAALPALAPWLLRFARQSLPGAARRNAAALAAILADASDRWRDLAAGIGVEGLMRDHGCLYLYDRPEQRRAAEVDLAMRRSLGIRVEMLSADELKQLEPGLSEMAGGAAFFPGARFVTDPGKMMAALADVAWRSGATRLTARAERIGRVAGGISVSGPDLTLHARRVVIAAGAHSRALARIAGDRIPLDTERGYHVEFDMGTPLLLRPACPTARGFYLCPMEGRLRVAGTVELGGLGAPPSPHRIALLERGARLIFPDLPAPARSWMGFRPSMPDSLPVIGHSAGGGDVLHAFGHGHIGLTLAPVTAAIIAALIAGRAPPVDIAPFRATRF